MDTMDERAIRTLLHEAARTPEPPSAVDVDAARRRGRGLVDRRRSGGRRNAGVRSGGGRNAGGWNVVGQSGMGADSSEFARPRRRCTLGRDPCPRKRNGGETNGLAASGRGRE